MAASIKYICYLLPIFVLLQQGTTFNVEELCAKRCLYGRGGVLCNCNAMHFNGKRSSVISNHMAHPSEHTSQIYSDIPRNDFSRERLVLQGNLKYDGSIYPDVTRAMENIGHDVNGVIREDSWEGHNFGNPLYNLGQNSDSGIAPVVSNDPDDVSITNDDPLLSMLLLKEDDKENHNEDNDDVDDDSISDRRLEAMSRIKEIMAAPRLEPSYNVASANVKNDLPDNFQEGNAQTIESSRKHLRQLQNVLRRVRQRR